jgi:6-phosphogluconolactonase
MKLLSFSDRISASTAAASWLATELDRALAQAGNVGLIVSGGSTPGYCLSLLSEADIDWHRVQVSLTDERCVPVTDSASNEKMVRETLLRLAAADASFRQVGELETSNIVCSLVGMGEDGHFASIFPDNPRLAELLDPGSPPLSFSVSTVGSEYKRRTVNLSYLLQGDAVALLVFGEAKKRIIDNSDGFPVAALLKQACIPVHVFWAP